VSYVDSIEQFKRLHLPGFACFTIRDITTEAGEDVEIAVLVAGAQEMIDALRAKDQVSIALRAGVLVEEDQVVLPVVLRLDTATYVLVLNGATDLTPECLFLLATQATLPIELYAEDGTLGLRYDVEHRLGRFGEETIEVLHVWDVAPFTDEVMERLARDYPNAEALWNAFA
jgi:hypothetical protein